MRSPLTERQQEIYNFIVAFVREYGFAPTSNEVRKHFNYNSNNSVVIHVKNIVEKGYLTKLNSLQGSKVRTLRITDDIIGVHTINGSKLKEALKNLETKKKCHVKLNDAVELLSELNIKIV
jgi:SOS-response transcriptional repressor LexA